MSESQSNPIVEAVLDIECDLPPNMELTNLLDKCELHLGKSYPNRETRYALEYTIEAKSESWPKGESRQEVDGYLFRNIDGNQLVQVRAGGYSFNRLKPYSSLDDYLPEVERTWDLYREIAQPIRVREIRLRYINRIDIVSIGGEESMGKYFHNIPSMPSGGLLARGFLSQYHAVELSTGNEVQTTITTLSRTESTTPVIVDIMATSRKGVEVGDWPGIRAQLISLRELKNRIYTGTLTEQCLRHYRQV